jgi:hypothetical protein
MIRARARALEQTGLNEGEGLAGALRRGLTFFVRNLS